MSSYFTYRRDSGGVNVLRKGVPVEHYSGTMLSTDRTRPDPHQLRELRRKSEHLETLGITASTNSAIWHWSWFEDCTADSPILPLIRLCPALYQHGFTKRDSERAKESCCPQYPLVEPDGSVIVIACGIPLLIRDGEVSVADVQEDEIDGWYHVLARKDYHTAKCGQPYHNGPCYANYAGVKAWCDDHGINEAVIAECLSILQRELNR